MTFSPVPTKPRVETLVSLDAAPVRRSFISIKPTPLPPFFPRKIAVKLPGRKVAKIAGSCEAAGWKATGIWFAFVAVCQSSLVAIVLPVESCRSSVGSCKGFTIPKLLKVAPSRASAAGAVHFSVEAACSPLKVISAEASKAVRIPGSFTSEQKTVTDRRTAARYGILGTRSVRNLAHCPTRLQPAGRVGPNAALTNILLLRYQIAV